MFRRTTLILLLVWPVLLRLVTDAYFLSYISVICYEISIKPAIVPCLPDDFDSSNIGCDGRYSFSRHLNSLCKETNTSSEICRKIGENRHRKVLRSAI